MDHLTLILGIMTVTLLGVAVHARRLGNETRDVALLGSFGGMFGLGTAAAALL